jgi:signal transduction histidine kinase
MPEGGTLSIATGLDHMTDAQGERVPAVRIDFRDTGVGIPPDQVAHVFEPFYTTKETGTGLGLAISFEIVHGFGGDITVASEIGAGTLFTVRLPLAPVQPPASA